MGPNSLLQNLNNFVPAMEYYTVLQAERVVQILKSAIKQAHLTIADVDAVIANHLLVYRTTPHSTTGERPSLLLIGRRLRNRLDLLTTSAEKYVEARQYITMHIEVSASSVPAILLWLQILEGEENG